eukprot:COSAG02_NODE_35994_length_460_cov_1.063712_1_plen_34_part_10
MKVAIWFRRRGVSIAQIFVSVRFAVHTLISVTTA